MKTKFYIPIFDHYIHVIIEDVLEYGTSAYVSFSEENKALYVVFDKSKITSSLIVHESVHLVNKIFLFKGVELDTKNDETQAYLTQYIYEQIKKIIK